MKVFVVFAVLVLLVGCVSQPVISEKQTSAVPEQAPLQPAESASSDIQVKDTTSPQTPVESTPEVASSVREFLVSAKNFEFLPSTIEVNKGDTVRLKIISGDTRHGITIQGYDIRKELPVNQEVVIEFLADKAGEFPFYCSVFCGSGHSAMKGLLIVT
ncbi:MAG: cupredoxin domain-containing protein [Candidatus Woesearchaeota archaeon]|nr:cupredoxin domain-containing protein [Candidatus Woesearchaeota archaeon]